MKNLNKLLAAALVFSALSLTACSKPAEKTAAPADNSPAAVLQNTTLTADEEKAVKDAQEAAAKANEQNAKDGNS